MMPVWNELDDDDIFIIETALWDNTDSTDTLRRDYPGRGMYGKTCVAFDVRSIPEACKVMVSICGDSFDLARNLADAMVADSMGTGIVVYFPGITAPPLDGDSDG